MEQIFLNTWSECVVNVTGHACPLLENCGLTLLHDQLLAMHRKHDVMCQSLRQFDFCRAIRALLRMMNADQATQLPRDKHRNTHEPAVSVALQIFTKFGLET